MLQCPMPETEAHRLFEMAIKAGEARDYRRAAELLDHPHQLAPGQLGVNAGVLLAQVSDPDDTDLDGLG